MSAEIPPQGRADRTVTSQLVTREIHVGDLLADRYRIVSMIGMGGMGVVFQAFDEQLQEPVAIKALHSKLEQDSEVLERFRNELLTARRVSHPNVVRLHDLVHDKDQERWFITMDFVAGESLQKVLDRQRSLGVEQTVRWIKQIASGLAAAHKRDIVHRDLKPANIMIDESGQALITDFGIARSMSKSGLTREGVLMGTPDYLSPEQARGDTVDGRSDLYALGLVMCEMLTGRLPFDAVTADEAITQRLARSPTPLTPGQHGVPRWLAQVCHRLLRRNVARRYQTADEALADLENQRVKVSIPWRRVAAISAMILVAVLAAWQLRDWRPPAETGTEPSSIQPATASTVAILGLTGPGTELSEALVGGLVERLAQAGASDLVGSLGVAVTLGQLDLRVDRVDAHLARIANELNSRELVVLRDNGGRLVAEVYGREDEFQQPVTLAVEGESLNQRMNGITDQLKTHLGLSKPVTEFTDNHDYLVAFRHGLMDLELGETLSARERLSQAAALDPGQPGAWWALSRAQEALGEWDQAVESAAKAVAAASGTSRYATLARARQAELSGDLEAAMGLLDGLIQTNPGDLTLLTLGAETLGEGGELEQASQRLKAVTDRYPYSPRAWFLLAKYSILAGQVQNALDEYLGNAQTLHNRLDNAQGTADVANAFGVAYERTGRVDLAIDHYQRAADQRARIGDKRGQASTLRNLSAMHAIQGDFERADQRLAEARDLMTELNDREGLADLLNDEGFLAEERGDYQAALVAYRESLKLRQDLADQQAIADSFSNVGYAYYQIGEYDNALVYWRQAETGYDKLGDLSGRVRVLQQIGLLQLAGGDWGDAETSLRETVLDAERNQMHEELAVSHAQLAEVLMARGHLDEALSLAGIADQAFSRRDDQRGRHEMALLNARIHLAAESPQGAAKVLAEAANLSEANLEQQAKRWLLQGEVAVRTNTLAEAEKALVQARDLAQQSGGRRTEIEVRVLAAHLHLARGTLEPGLHDEILAASEELGHASVIFDVMVGGLGAALARDDQDAIEAWYQRIGSFAQRLGPLAGGPLACRLRLDACRKLGGTCQPEESRLAESRQASQQTLADSVGTN